MAGLAERLLTVLISIPLLLLWLWLAKTYDQPWLVILLLTLVTALASWEYAKLIGQSGIPLERFSFVILSMLTIIASGVFGEEFNLLIFSVASLILMARYLAHQEGIKSIAIAVLGLFYLPYLLHFFYPLYRQEQGFYHVLLLLLLVWGYDIGAYLVGSVFGRHKLFPTLSPKKSWEGVLGGWAFAFMVGWSSLTWMPWAEPVKGEVFHALAISLLISGASQLGDLFESKLKRTANVKDSGILFPGHGGILDRIDSLLFALPIFYFYFHHVLRLL